MSDSYVTNFAKKVADRKARDGGAAFPFVMADDEAMLAHTGMSLRDWFAGQAIMGALIEPMLEHVPPSMIAQKAYSIADAMLEERDR